jgi:hypothetical protein
MFRAPIGNPILILLPPEAQKRAPFGHDVPRGNRRPPPPVASSHHLFLDVAAVYQTPAPLVNIGETPNRSRAMDEAGVPAAATAAAVAWLRLRSPLDVARSGYALEHDGSLHDIGPHLGHPAPQRGMR